jgi:LmbE family N-acetylglucosaminyl deacetylase
MKLQLETAEIYVPDGRATKEALARTTHLAVSAHQDDLEIMAIDGVLRCFRQDDRWFTGVVVTNGAGSPRDDLYRDYTDEAMRKVRAHEQKKAAFVGEYAAQLLLDYPSGAVKSSADPRPLADLVAIMEATRPEVVYTHNLADKHPTHVAVALRVIEAARRVSKDARPSRVYGCEVWRNLDWMGDEEKVVFDCSAHESLQAALLGVFDSQICGGKRYDLATMGRRKANATYFESHGVDEAQELAYAMDLTPLVTDPRRDVAGYVVEHIDRFAANVRKTIGSVC